MSWFTAAFDDACERAGTYAHARARARALAGLRTRFLARRHSGDPPGVFRATFVEFSEALRFLGVPASRSAPMLYRLIREGSLRSTTGHVRLILVR